MLVAMIRYTAPTVSPRTSGAEYDGLSSRPRQADIVKPSSTCRTVSQAFRNVYSCMHRPRMTGTITPSTLLRVRIETRIAMAAKPSVAGSTESQLAATSPSAEDDERSVPPTSTSGSLPTVTMPATVALTATVATASVVIVNAAPSLPQNTAVRSTDRVRIVFSVPPWSSEEKTAPAIIAAMSGRSHSDADPRDSSRD